MYAKYWRKWTFNPITSKIQIQTWSHVEDVGDAACESDHDDGEGDEEEEDVLHHVVHAQDDGAKVLARDANLKAEFKTFLTGN